MAAQPIVAPLTSDEFLRQYSEMEDGLDRFELFDGEVVARPIPNRIHDYIKNLISARLVLYFERFPGYLALVETTFRLGDGITFTPDLAVTDAGRWRRMNETFATGSPDIAFEVVSTDKAERLQFKIDSYLEHGSKAACCIYPNRQRIAVFMLGQWIEFKDSDHLEFPSLLPGFSLPLPLIFA